MKTSSVRLLNTVRGRLFPRLSAGYKQEPKSTKPVDYVKVRGEDGLIHDISEQMKIEDVFQVQITKGTNQKPPRGLIKSKKDDKPLPCVATLGPVTVRNPEIFTKKYKWCSCGMSKKQVPID